jgi:hypothetical protein
MKGEKGKERKGKEKIEKPMLSSLFSFNFFVKSHVNHVAFKP